MKNRKKYKNEKLENWKKNILNIKQIIIALVMYRLA